MRPGRAKGPYTGFSFYKKIGSLNLLVMGNSALGYDPVTGESGPLLRVIQRTGGVSVKGELVSCSLAADDSLIKQSNEYDAVGVIAQAGIADGELCWVWSEGAIAQVLYEDGEAATRGNILLAAPTDGRGIDIANPGGGLPGTDTHFKENGHVMQSVASGTDILARCWLHHN